MSSTTPKKPLSNNTMSTSATGRRQSTNPSRSDSPVTRGTSPSGVLSTNGSSRTSSSKTPSSGVTRPGRASVRRPGQNTSNLGGNNLSNAEDVGLDDDARIENAALIDNLKKSLRNAELVSEDYQQQLAVTQKRLDDMMRDQNKLEERLHESGERIEELEVKKKEASRQVRDMGNMYESERTSMLRDREEAHTRETEYKATIQRLKETMAGREMRFNVDADSRRHSRTGKSWWKVSCNCNTD